MSQFFLLGTSACHLCEQAEALLVSLQIPYSKIDIAEHEQYQANYAVKIPVLLSPDEQHELCWPFDKDKLINFQHIIAY